MYFNALIVII